MAVPARILITGYRGFVGTYLVEACRQRYPQATLFGLTEHSTDPTGPNDVQAIRADITNQEAMRQAIAQTRPDLVFHLAAQSSVALSWKVPPETLRVNAFGTVYLLESLRAEQPAPKIVLVGSGEQYGMVRPEENPISEECPFRPANPYAVSKVTQDLYGYQYFMAYGLPIIRARPFNHFGPHQTPTTVIARFAQQIALIEAGRLPPALAVGNLQARRDFLAVEDVVSAYLALAEHGHPGEAYNIGSGEARAIHTILDFLLSLASVPIEIHTAPALLRPMDVPLLEADTSRLRTHTPWKPDVPFELALQRTLNYWRTTVAAEKG